KTAGVADIPKFTAAVESGKFEDAVREDTAEAQRIGVTGVPFFATTGCGQVLSGAQPVDTFRQQLDAAVAAAKK
ncbi:MAG: DsbA family protein, partial [Leucobacter sp.]|nr:DsbA family protein [Leucobacter sp.]